MTTYTWGDAGDRDPRLDPLPVGSAAPAPAPTATPEPVESDAPENVPSMCATQLLLAAALLELADQQLVYDTDRRSIHGYADFIRTRLYEVMVNSVMSGTRLDFRLEGLALKPGIPGQQRLSMARELVRGAIADVELADPTGKAIMQRLHDSLPVFDALGQELIELEEDSEAWRTTLQ